MGPAPPQVYWIGGVSGAGRSAVTRILVGRGRLVLHRRDDYIASHRERVRPETEPISFQRQATGGPTVAEKLREPPAQYARFMLSLGREDWRMTLEDLSECGFDDRTIIEGNRNLPEQIATWLHSSANLAWLAPSVNALRRNLENDDRFARFAASLQGVDDPWDRFARAAHALSERQARSCEALGGAAIRYEDSTRPQQVAEQVAKALRL